MSKTPAYKHDCEKCTFLFNYNNYDVYKSCSEYDSYLFRFDNNPEDYLSYPIDSLLRIFIDLKDKNYPKRG